ncbi:dipeptidase [Oerskovia sp. Root22]|uniref:dipeptidase n=1 Tax=Oerskovia sp. Root22 TaxID=1736494 RepID=UPI0006FB5648|nr:dipeptidase [Oerskovia sp. Root22]KRC37557.1 beta-Ala-His dipeptidase [Oerskovia sp. Root22]
MSSAPEDLTPVQEQVASLLPRALDDLRTLVAIPSVADERLFPREDCESAAHWVADAFRAEGIDDARLVETPDGSNVVLGYRPGPPGAPTVLLYSHYDVQPPLDDAAWHTPPFELTERDGRLYGRGSADCKGNIVTHLTALRALRALGGDDFPVGVRIVIEGSEEQGTGGLDQYVEAHPGELTADAILIADTGNATLGLPTLTVSLRGATNVVVTVEALKGEIHSGMFGGAAPDALAALVHLLSSLRDEEGNTTIDGIPPEIADATWPGVDYDPDQFRSDAGMLEGTRLLGSGRVSDQLWARPAVTILGIDAPNVVGSAAAIQPRAAARLNLRVPPGADAQDLQDKLVAHLENHAPWGVKVTTTRDAVGQPFQARTDGHVFDTLSRALADAFGKETVTAGQGGSIPLCNVLASEYPDAQIVLLGVEEPACLIHAPNESVAPSEIEQLAVGEALFLSRLGAGASQG